MERLQSNAKLLSYIDTEKVDRECQSRVSSEMREEKYTVIGRVEMVKNVRIDQYGRCIEGCASLDLNISRIVGGSFIQRMNELWVKVRA